MLNRIQKIWKMSNKPMEVIDSLYDEKIDALPNEGDGKAVFFSEGTEEEYNDFKQEEDGTKLSFKNFNLL